MRSELADECDYTREAAFLRRFRAGLERDERFTVPWAWERSTQRVLVMQHVSGVSIGAQDVAGLPQAERDEARALSATSRDAR
jgi:aarF domain-containing kinase